MVERKQREVSPFGTLLRNIRTIKGMKQTELSRLSSVDVSYISQIENGMRTTYNRAVIESLVNGLQIDNPQQRLEIFLVAGCAGLSDLVPDRSTVTLIPDLASHNVSFSEKVDFLLSDSSFSQAEEGAIETALLTLAQQMIKSFKISKKNP